MQRFRPPTLLCSRLLLRPSPSLPCTRASCDVFKRVLDVAAVRDRCRSTSVVCAFRTFEPALALTLLDPQLNYSNAAETSAGGADGQASGQKAAQHSLALSATDLRRLQVPCLLILPLRPLQI